MTQIDELFVQIAQFVLKQNDFSFPRAQTMIKSYTEKLSQTGDISFPTTIQPWLNIIENQHDLYDRKQIINENEDEFAQKLIETSLQWTFPIETVKFKQFRCLLFLDRPTCFSRILKTVLDDDPAYGQWYRTNGAAKKIYAVQLVNQLNENTLVELRCMLIAKVLTKLLKVSGFEIASKETECAKNLVKIFVSCPRRDDPKRVNRQKKAENNNNNDNKSGLIVCGSVSNRSGYTADDIIRLRSLEMEKRSEFRYGHNNKNDDLDKCQKIGTAIVTFDLLKIKHFNPIDFEKLMCPQSIIKGAAFILYNVARLQKLLATFDQQVARRFYAPLPDFAQIDFGLLNIEEEWQILYVYIIGFPSMLERCVSGIDNGQTAIHLLCTFLSNLSALFSVYYHRVKILTDNLPQLVPVMYARIYFLKALRTIFLKSLMILGIEPLDEM